MIFKRKTALELKTHRESKAAKYLDWHKWFAWYPVSWDGGIAWLSYVERRCIKREVRHFSGYYIIEAGKSLYREIPKQEIFKKKFKDEVKL